MFSKRMVVVSANSQRVKPQRAKTSDIQGEIIYPPPALHPFLARRHVSGEGGGGVNFEAAHGRNFIPPPLLYNPPPREGYFQGWRGGGVSKFGPVCKLRGRTKCSQKIFQKISPKIEDITFLDIFEIFAEDGFLLRSFRKFLPLSCFG